jgi:DNA polymerase III alpha subunit
VDLRKANKRVIESLIKCGAFDRTGSQRAQLLAGLEEKGHSLPAPVVHEQLKGGVGLRL